MFVLDSLLVGGLRFVLDKVATAVDSELNDDTALREELLALQMRYELGEIGDEELAVRERELLDRLRALRPEPEGGGAISFGGGAGYGVDVGFEGDFGEGLESGEEPPRNPRDLLDEEDRDG